MKLRYFPQVGLNIGPVYRVSRGADKLRVIVQMPKDGKRQVLWAGRNYISCGDVYLKEISFDGYIVLCCGNICYNLRVGTLLGW